MLLNDFYTVGSLVKGEGVVNAQVTFNKNHPIFNGHFPGQPVVPGVTMMQLVREILELVISQKLSIKNGDNLKFLSVINPNENETVNVTINYTRADSNFTVTASLFLEKTTFFKFKGSFHLN